MDQLIKTAGGHAARRVRWRLGGWCGRLGHGLASPVVGAALCYCGARGGSVGRLPLLCVRSDVSRRAASCARGGGACFWRLCRRSRPSSQLLRAGSARRSGWAMPGTCFAVRRRRLGCVRAFRAFWWVFGGHVTIRRFFVRACRMTSLGARRGLFRPSAPPKCPAGSRGVASQHHSLRAQAGN